jgi:broad specificity phosphatase PhoE
VTKVLLIRHAQSIANTGDMAFANFESPLTDTALSSQIPKAREELIEQYGINPDEYDRPVAASEYYRTYQTARELGFRCIDRIGMINESDIYNSGDLTGVDVIQRHVEEDGWLPEQELSRAQEIIESMQSGSLDYEIIFSHGMVIAGILSEYGVYR